MPRPRPVPLLTLAATLALFGLTLRVGLDPLLAGDGGSGGAGLAGEVLLGLAAVSAAIALLMVEPAWPLSLGLAAMMFSGNWELFGVPLALDRALIAIGLLSLLLRARSLRDLIGGRPSAVHWLLAVATLYVLCSAALSGTIGDRVAVFGLFDRFGVVPFVLFAVAPVAFGDRHRRTILLGTLTVAGAYLVYVSIMGRVGPDSLVWPGYIVDPTIGIHADRARGPFLEAGANGLALFECGVAALVLASMRIDLDRRLRGAAVAVAIGCAGCIVLTLTRSVWAASAVALVAAMLTTPQTRRLLVPAAAAAAATVLIALALVPGLSEDVSFRESDQRPLWDRENANGAALRMIDERPLLGFGWFSFPTESGVYQRLADDHILTRAGLEEHNVFLSNAVELGLIGTLLWAAALFVAVGGAIVRRGPPELVWWRVGMVAIAVQWFVVANFVPLSYALPNALLWLWAGVLWPRSAERAAPREEPELIIRRMPEAALGYRPQHVIGALTASSLPQGNRSRSLPGSWPSKNPSGSGQ